MGILADINKLLNVNIPPIIGMIDTVKTLKNNALTVLSFCSKKKSSSKLW